MNFDGTRYFLQSMHSGQTFADSGWTLDAPGETEPTLIRAIYEHRQLTLQPQLPGLYQFAQWLPIQRILEGSSSPITYKSEHLAKFLNLHHLWITFSGWWPEKEAYMSTCSFKETEAYAVCGRMDGRKSGVLVVASAGNTARAFAKVCSDNHIPLLLCVPEDNLDALWFEHPLSDSVKLICSPKGSDYYDAIHLSNIVSGMEGFVAEGGARNVARRDGMGTTMLSAVTTIGAIPDLYFQAIGSGTGAIAAWEANLRFLSDGRYGNTKTRLMISQNAPFLPIYDAWRAGSRAMLPLDDALARKQVEAIDAKVLSNRKPPYPAAGGLYDALTDSHGDVLVASNEEATEAAQLFKSIEGIDIHPAAAVATASLVSEVRKGNVDPNAVIMLNITGGGEALFKQNKQLHYLKPNWVASIDPSTDEVVANVRQLF